MNLAAIISALVALAKAVPAIAGLCHRLIELCEQYDTKKNESTALKRLEEKDASVDAAIDGLRVRPPETKQ